MDPSQVLIEFEIKFPVCLSINIIAMNIRRHPKIESTHRENRNFHNFMFSSNSFLLTLGAKDSWCSSGDMYGGLPETAGLWCREWSSAAESGPEARSCFSPCCVSYPNETGLSGTVHRIALALLFSYLRD
jgi:hypothetical protein